MYDLEFWIYYAIIGSTLTYLVWGFVVAFEVVLAMSGSQWAIEWIKKRYRYKILYYEVIVFYPMILLGYLFLELVPHLLFKAELAVFDMQALFDKLYKK